jgi:hypothetical protein
LLCLLEKARTSKLHDSVRKGQHCVAQACWIAHLPLSLWIRFPGVFEVGVGGGGRVCELVVRDEVGDGELRVAGKYDNDGGDEDPSSLTNRNSSPLKLPTTLLNVWPVTENHNPSASGYI